MGIVGEIAQCRRFRCRAHEAEPSGASKGDRASPVLLMKSRTWSAGRMIRVGIDKLRKL